MPAAFVHTTMTRPGRPEPEDDRRACVVLEVRSQAGRQVDIAGRVAGKYGEEGSPRGSDHSHCHGGGLPAGRRPRWAIMERLFVVSCLLLGRQERQEGTTAILARCNDVFESYWNNYVGIVTFTLSLNNSQKFALIFVS